MPLCFSHCCSIASASQVDPDELRHRFVIDDMRLLWTVPIKHAVVDWWVVLGPDQNDTSKKEGVCATYCRD